MGIAQTGVIGDQTGQSGRVQRVTAKPPRRTARDLFLRLPLTTRVWIQVLSLIVLPSVALAIGAAGVAFKRTWYDSKQFLVQLAESEAKELGSSIEAVGSVVDVLVERDGLGAVGQALRVRSEEGVSLGMERVVPYLIGLRQVAAVVVINQGAVAWQMVSPRHGRVLAVPMMQTGDGSRAGTIGAIGSVVDGQQYIRVDYMAGIWPEGATLRVFISVDSSHRGGKVEPSTGRGGTATLLVRDQSGTDFKQIPWGSNGSMLDPGTRTLSEIVEAFDREGGAEFEDTLGVGHFGAEFRVPGQDAYVALRMPKSAASLAPMVTAGVTLAAVLLVSMLVAMRIGNYYLSTVDVVRARALKLIRKIDPEWTGDVDSVAVLVEVFEKLDDVVQGHHTKLTREIEQRAEAIEMIQLRLLDASRMAAVGEIAGGVMHEVGQPLNVLRLMLDDLEEEAGGGEIRLGPDELSRMRKALQRILSIQEGIRDRARPVQQARKKMDLGHVVTSTNTLYQIHSKVHGISLVEVIASEKPIFVNGNETEISQCLSNLMTNSVEALKDYDCERRKEIRIRLEKEDGWAVLTVEDNGPGMSREAINRAFEIGFTTKDAGTGFGLNTCRRFVEVQHKGKISIESVEGEFTRVIVRLPMYPELDA